MLLRTRGNFTNANKSYCYCSFTNVCLGLSYQLDMSSNQSQWLYCTNFIVQFQKVKDNSNCSRETIIQMEKDYTESKKSYRRQIIQKADHTKDRSYRK